MVNVVRETGGSGRRKRQTAVTYFYVEVGDAANDTSSPVDIGKWLPLTISHPTSAVQLVLIHTLILHFDSSVPYLVKGNRNSSVVRAPHL